ncbi:hypothetical protein FRB99_007553 [Tulasnella sp. 403]|nr:hypothetical protein FRB99_007553 [Tulasnella sp. 403]
MLRPAKAFDKFPVFRGKGSRVKCEDFIQHIHRASFLSGRTEDAKWMAYLGMSHLSGEALHWWHGLDPQSRLNWWWVEERMLGKYGSDFEHESSESSVSVLPPNTGRIRISSSEPGLTMYIRRTPIDYSSCFGGTCDANEALVVTVDRSTKRIEIWDPSNSGTTYLGITWKQRDPDITTGSWHWGRMAVVSAGSNSTVRSSFGKAEGPSQVDVWKLSESEEIIPVWTHPTRGEYQLEMAVNMAQIVDVEAVACYQGYYDKHKGGYPAYRRVYLMFEPLS